MVPYALCLRPFLTFFNRKMAGIKIWNRTRPNSVVAYADDVTIFVTAAADFAIIEEAIRGTVKPTKIQKKNCELVSKAKIELQLFQQYFTSQTPPLNQGESETNLGLDLPRTRIIHSTIPIRKCSKLCSPMSDLVTRYVPQATTRFTCLVLVPLENGISKSECW